MNDKESGAFADHPKADHRSICRGNCARSNHANQDITPRACANKKSVGPNGRYKRYSILIVESLYCSSVYCFVRSFIEPLWLRNLSARAREGDRSVAFGPVGTGCVPHWRWKIALLSAARAADRGVNGCCFAADRVDERPDRLSSKARNQRGTA